MNTWKEVRFNEHYWCQNKKFTFHKKYGWEVRVAIWKADKDLKVEQVGDQDDGVAEQESQAMVETMMIDQIKSRTYLVVAGCFQHIVKTHLGQNNVWRRTGCNGGKATMAEANCESQCERYLRPTVNKYLTEKYLSPSGKKYRMPTWRGKKLKPIVQKYLRPAVTKYTYMRPTGDRILGIRRGNFSSIWHLIRAVE